MLSRGMVLYSDAHSGLLHQYIVLGLLVSYVIAILSFLRHITLRGPATIGIAEVILKY